MPDSQTTLATIQAERHFKASPSRMFASWSDYEARKRGKPTPDGFEMLYESFDFRTAGIEKSSQPDIQPFGTTGEPEVPANPEPKRFLRQARDERGNLFEWIIDRPGMREPRV